MLSLQGETEAAERRTGIGEDAEGIASFRDRIPGTVFGLQIHFGDRRDRG